MEAKQYTTKPPKWITDHSGSVIKQEFKNISETKENRNLTVQNLQDEKSSSKKGIYSNTSLPQKNKKNLKHTILTLHLKELEKNNQNPKLAEDKTRNK